MRATRRVGTTGWTIIRSPDGDLLARHCTLCGKMFSRKNFPNNPRTYCTPCDRDRMKSNPRIRLSNYLAILRTKERNMKRTKPQVEATRNRLRPDGLKTCSKCKEKKTFDMYDKDRSLTDGLKYACKVCVIRSRKG